MYRPYKFKIGDILEHTQSGFVYGKRERTNYYLVVGTTRIGRFHHRAYNIVMIGRGGVNPPIAEHRSYIDNPAQRPHGKMVRWRKVGGINAKAI